MDQQTDASITKQYNSKQDLLLPATDHQFGLRNFTSLFLRPTTALRDSGKVTAGGASEGIEHSKHMIENIEFDVCCVQCVSTSGTTTILPMRPTTRQMMRKVHLKVIF